MFRKQCVLALVTLSVGLVHSWDIAVTAGDELLFLTNETKTYAESVKGQNFTALAYDEVRKKLMYVDKQSDNDTICVHDIFSKDYKCLIERNGRNIQGFAFDPATEMLFFTDANERSINWISLKHTSKNNVYGNLLIKMDDEIPGAIAVDSCRRYIYWVNTNSTIERARFNGLEREVIIHNNRYFMPVRPLSLAIDQQTQKIYWMISMYGHYVHSADLNGKNKKMLCIIQHRFPPQPNAFTISNDSIYWVDLSKSYKSIWKLSKSDSIPTEPKEIFTFYSEGPVGIAANYKIEEQTQGIQKCEGLTDLLPIIMFCVHGVKVDGKSLCKCSPGYTGDRCDVSVCQNYCFQGDCTVSAEGQPKCRCNAGYSGERCEVKLDNACHGYCLNNGVCSLNEENEPTCQCMGDYEGERCGVPVCLNYCIQGECSYIVEGQLKCRCDAGYSGERCEVNTCHGYCLNNGICSLNNKSEPVCQCTADHEGERCDVSVCQNYCFQGDCSVSAEGHPKCSCNADYSGESSEVDACRGYCLNNGVCSLNEEDEPVCQCIGNYEGSRCEVVSDVTFTTTPTCYSAKTMNLTLAYLLSILQKPAAKILEINSN